MQMTDGHRQALVLADAKIPQERTVITDELRAEGALDKGRYYLGTFGQGWLWEVTARGLALMSETPIAQGCTRRLATWANGHR